jgi:uncharacterized protein YbjT (DUF2867 family)
MILVTGATGNVGSEVVKQLAQAGHKVRALVRDPKEATGKLPTTVDVVIGDLDNVDSLINAMKGVAKMYMLAPLTPSLQQYEINLVEAARRTKLQHIVKHSVLGAQWESITLAKWHRAGERLVEATASQWAHIRPSGFYANALGWAAMVRSGGTVYYPTGEGKHGVVDPRDVASVAVKCLTEPGHSAKTYDVTGPVALSTREQVEIIGRAIGKQLKFVDIPEQVARDSMLGAGTPAVIAELTLEFCAAIKSGHGATVTDTVKKLTGKTPRTFESWTQEMASQFR